MQNNRVWQRACGLTRTVVEGVRVDDNTDAIIVSVRPDSRARSRCGRCGRRSPGYDQGAGRRRWRALDAGTTRVFIEAEAQRVRCRLHGPTVAQVPWARHDVGHTRDFDAMAAWLTVRTSKSATCQLLRVAWRTIGSIITRVNDDVEAVVDRLVGLRRIGIDEISYKRGHRYLIVVVDHDTGRLVWAGPGRSEAALNVFFDELGDERAGLITHVSADMAEWIAKTVAARAPNAIRCADPFHVVAWAIEALDIERRRAWNQAAGRRVPPVLAVGDEPPATPDRSPGLVTHCGRTPRTSTGGNAINSTGSPRPTRDCGGPTSSKKASDMCSRSKEPKAKKHSTSGCPGLVDHNFHRSLSWQPGSPNTAKRSTPTSNTAYRKD